jgi:hypothetical protein
LDEALRIRDHPFNDVQEGGAGRPVPPGCPRNAGRAPFPPPTSRVTSSLAGPCDVTGRLSAEGGTRRHATQPIRNRVLLTSRWCLHPSIHVRECPTFTPPDVTCGLTRLRQRGPKGLPTAASAKLFLPRRARGQAGVSDERRPLGASGSAWSVADRRTTKATCAHGQPLLGSVEHPAVHD